MVNPGAKFSEDNVDRLLGICAEITELAKDKFDIFYAQYPDDVRLGTIVTMAELVLADASLTMDIMLASQDKKKISMLGGCVPDGGLVFNDIPHETNDGGRFCEVSVSFNFVLYSLLLPDQT